MVQLILTAIGFFIVGIIFSWLKGKIVHKAISTSKDLITNSKVGNIYRKDGEEVFSWTKFKKIFYLGSGVEWIKSIKEIIDLRKFTIYLTIIGIVFAYGWWKGQGDKPVNLDIGRYQEVVIKLNGDQLHIYKGGEVWIEDSKTGQKKKRVKVKDVPYLYDHLKPLQLKLRPIIVGGGSAGIGGTGAEIGAGVSFIDFWKMSLEAFVTSYPAVYAGCSYAITDTMGIGLGYGKGIKDFDDRVIVYGRIRF